MKGEKGQVAPRVDSEVDQPLSFSRRLYEDCEWSLAQRGRYRAQGQDTAQGFPKIIPKVKFIKKKACKGHQCLGCSDPGVRCAGKSEVVVEDYLDYETISPTLEAGQLPLHHKICEAILSEGCCNTCPTGECNCGLSAPCETFLTNGFERFRQYFTFYKKFLRKKNKNPLVLYGPYKDSVQDATTPPPPGNSDGLAVGLAVVALASGQVRCRFGVHPLVRHTRRSLIDCQPSD